MIPRTPLLAALLLMLLATSAMGQKEKKQKKQKKANDPIAQQLTSGDATQIQAAVRQIREMLESEPSAAISQLRKNKGWMGDLLAAGQYDDAAELAQQAILLRPAETPLIDSLLPRRIEALLAAGKSQKAVEAAKSFYNVSSMEQTGAAIQLLAQALSAAYPHQPQMTMRFKRQQMYGAATQPSDDEADLDESILKGIQINPTAYEAALQSQGDSDTRALMAKGNLLLLADRPTEAKEAFERAYSLARDADRSQAAEGVARSIKAQDGSIRRSNAWVLSVRPK